MRWLTCIIGVLLFAGCKKPPVACLDIEQAPYLTPSHPVAFENCSQQADVFLWDFDDGTTSTEASPTHRFPGQGTYRVNLTASNDKESVSITHHVFVDYPIFRTVRINALPATAPNGDPWDPNGTGPDVRVRVINTNNPPFNIDYSSPIIQNLDTQLPFEFTLTDELFQTACCSWTIMLLDVNATVDTIAVMKKFHVDWEEKPIHSEVTAEGTDWSVELGLIQ